MAYFNCAHGKLFYDLIGNPEADETIVFLNGVAATASSWNFQTEFFKNYNYKILVHDFMGQLLSDKPDNSIYSFSQHCEDLLALTRHLGISKFHVIGTSYGGEIGMRLSIDYPEVVSSLTLVDSASELDHTLKNHVLNWRELATQKDPERFYRGMAPSLYSQTFLKHNTNFIEERVKVFKQVPESFFHGQVILYDTLLKDLNITSELNKIKSPTMVICGEEDVLCTVKFARIIAENVKNAEYIIFPDTGHVTFFEKPAVLNSVILGFLKKHSDQKSVDYANINN